MDLGILLALSAAATFLTQVGKGLVTWIGAQPKIIALVLCFLGALLVFRAVSASMLLSVAVAALAAVGIYEWAIRPFVRART
jgi:hypothetical protein